MNLGEILQDSYLRLGFSETPEAQVTTRLSAFADETQKEILREPGCESLTRIQLTFSTVANQAEYGLGMALARINCVRDVSNEQWLQPMSESEYRMKYVDPSKTGGRPFYYVPLAIASVALRPSDPSQVFVVSTSASDVQTVFWEVLLSSGERREGETTLTGITALSLDTSLTTIVQVLDVYLAQPANGTVTILEDSGAGTELGRITLGQTKAQRRQLALLPRPTDVRTITVEGESDATNLINLNDTPILPERFHPMIGVGIRKKEFELRGNKDRWLMADREWQEWRGALRQWLDPTGMIIPGGRKAGWSSLGAHFPAEFYR